MEVPNKQEWTSAFNNIFAELSSKVLPKSSYHSFEARDPLIYSTIGLAIFRCSKCNRFWESQNGVIRFSYRLVLDRSTRIGKGEVTLAAFGQKCNQCPNTPYIPAKFAVESMDDALLKLLLKVKEKFYDENHSAELAELEGRRHGEGRGVHDTARCQACAMGMCSHRNESATTNHGRNKCSCCSHRNLRVGPTPTNTCIRWILQFGSRSDSNNSSSTFASRAAQNQSTQNRPRTAATYSSNNVSTSSTFGTNSYHQSDDECRIL